MQSRIYKYKLPEGYSLKPEHRDKLDKLVYGCYLSNPEAQAFLDLHVELMEEYATALEQADHKSAIADGAL